ncbi:DNA polymerase/3'-5' exonuclease PolX [Rummeliibacillus stabekisii]|uniref:DNA polymerase/3'-5' exonuclease PolX n=1 Tax=Rummeliibacillus stabekisii TaxID=241244 RepID=UPI002041ADFD|nr:DNA polymerase/3'-5' exonuclease PolX [Rummeliibacillus stabekisii]MCM3316935.1 DNA polymerase/3'-5' exonuclease PolX [Rummeliibacillus stabekisii]
MNKKNIIHTLEQIALYLELKGENPFKIAAFRKAAQALETDTRSMSEIDDITAIKGIGKGTAAVITDLLENGRSEVLLELQNEIPKGLPPLLKLPGLGGKKIAKLYKELGVDSAESLRVACEEGKVAAISGFGKKTQEKIMKELESFGEKAESHPIWLLDELVTQLNELLEEIQEIDEFSVAGSFRRVKEQSKDIDFIIATENPPAVKEALLSKLSYQEIIASGDTKISVELQTEGIQVDFRLVSNEEYATALHHFTGSKDHNVRMRQLAKEHGEKISEYGIEQQDGKVLTFDSETAFFAHYNLPFIPPTVRMGGKEFDRLDQIPDLIELSDIQADLHMHTTWSDGAYAVHEMGQALIDKGYQYGVITDHSQYLKVANGLTPERLEKQRLEIQAFNKEHPEFTLLAGTEMDILPDGSLDFDDEVMADLDFVIASIHSSFSQPQEKIMERLHTALKNSHVDMIAHPTGRIIGKRDGYNPDVPQLIAWAKEYGKILELNANPYRLDLCMEHLEMAARAGVPIAINTDAHAIDQLRFMEVGTKYAQKAWLKKENIVNTWSLKDFMNYLQKK